MNGECEIDFNFQGRTVSCYVIAIKNAQAVESPADLPRLARPHIAVALVLILVYRMLQHQFQESRPSKDSSKIGAPSSTAFNKDFKL